MIYLFILKFFASITLINIIGSKYWLSKFKSLTFLQRIMVHVQDFKMDSTPLPSLTGIAKSWKVVVIFLTLTGIEKSWKVVVIFLTLTGIEKSWKVAVIFLTLSRESWTGWLNAPITILLKPSQSVCKWI